MSDTHGYAHQQVTSARAKDVATVIDMPSRRNSTEPLDGYHLEACDPHDHIDTSLHDVVRDRKTGRHYKKSPAWSLAHANSDVAPRIVDPRSHQTKFSLGHTIADSGAREPGTAGWGTKSTTHSRGGSGANTPPLVRGGGVASAPALSAADVHNLVERLRSVVREEVSHANRGHAERLERVVTENIALDDNRGGLPPVATYEHSHDHSEASDGVSEKHDTKTAIIDPLEAARGIVEGSADDYEFPNPWAKLRYRLREPFAEALGCFILMTFGNGINIQALFSAEVDPTAQKGNYLSVSFGWGIAVAMAVYVCGGVSGHINPAVTVSLALFRGFPWKKVPGYIFAQIVGATFGALCIYGLYIIPVRMVDPEQTQLSAQYFTTFPADFIMTKGTRIIGFYNEVYASAILLMVILAVNDGSNTPPPDGMAPLVLLWLITGIGATLGWQTAYAVNPARDLGPRIALSIVGYRGLWTFDAWYWVYTPLLGPLVGAPLGCLIYDALIYTGAESPLNMPWKWSDIRWRKTSKKIPAGISDPATPA